MGYASLKEVETDWNINDVADCFDAMEMKGEIEKITMEKK